MILVDTSVWIDYLNGKESSLTNILDKALIDGLVSIGDLILLEILQGIKTEREYNKTRAALALLEQYEMFGHTMVEKCAENFRFLRKKGITTRKTNGSFENQVGKQFEFILEKSNLPVSK